MQEIKKTFTYNDFFQRLEEDKELYVEVNRQMIMNGFDPLGTLITLYQGTKSMSEHIFRTIESRKNGTI